MERERPVESAGPELVSAAGRALAAGPGLRAAHRRGLAGRAAPATALAPRQRRRGRRPRDRRELPRRRERALVLDALQTGTQRVTLGEDPVEVGALWLSYDHPLRVSISCVEPGAGGATTPVLRGDPGEDYRTARRSRARSGWSSAPSARRASRCYSRRRVGCSRWLTTRRAADASAADRLGDDRVDEGLGLEDLEQLRGFAGARRSAPGGPARAGCRRRRRRGPCRRAWRRSAR